jgi:hypothetical protein
LHTFREGHRDTFGVLGHSCRGEEGPPSATASGAPSGAGAVEASAGFSEAASRSRSTSRTRAWASRVGTVAVRQLRTKVSLRQACVNGGKAPAYRPEPGQGDRKDGIMTKDTAAGERLERLRHLIEQWRRTRRQHGPMPRELWEEAAELGRSLGVSQVARGLGLGYAALQQRVRGEPEVRNEAPESPAPAGRGAFLEVPRSALRGATQVDPLGGEVHVEVVAADGASMRLWWQAPSAREVAELVAAFRGRGA